MSGWVDALGQKKETAEERLQRIKGMIREQQQAPVSPINLAIYGHDGTCKSGACMDIRTEADIAAERNVFIIDVDGSAGPLWEHYWKKDSHIIIFDPNDINEETGEIDWIRTYQNMHDIARYLRLEEKNLNLRAVVIDGLDSFFKGCEHKMRIADLKVGATARIDMFSWGIRNNDFLTVVKLIKGLRCDKLYTTHLKPEKGWEVGPDGSKSLVTTNEYPYWESTMPNLLFQKLKAERIEEQNGKIVKFVATVEKSKTNSIWEGKKITMLTINHSTNPPTAEWHGIKDFLEACRH
jgi:hypothetical protein